MMMFFWGLTIWFVVGVLCGAINLTLYGRNRLNYAFFFLMVLAGPLGIPLMLIRSVMRSWSK